MLQLYSVLANPLEIRPLLDLKHAFSGQKIWVRLRIHVFPYFGSGSDSGLYYNNDQWCRNAAYKNKSYLKNMQQKIILKQFEEKNKV